MTFPIAHWPDAHFPNAHWPHERVPQGGGGGRKKVKSWDQRQREREEQIRKDAEAKIKDKYGDMPKALEDALKPAPSPYKRLSPATVKAYANAANQDDEEAMSIIMGLL